MKIAAFHRATIISEKLFDRRSCLKKKNLVITKRRRQEEHDSSCCRKKNLSVFFFDKGSILISRRNQTHLASASTKCVKDIKDAQNQQLKEEKNGSSRWSTTLNMTQTTTKNNTRTKKEVLEKPYLERGPV
jgi:hypothetical protein